ncbi:histidine phosphatase family protein [uncultured Nocardioides sp.]|uniref:histidine phosphatase family protein n=1 Tax=uncultured Nocardioides sp. TaxID=198441 RepID=UPI00260BE508|nr:histidine phosphatase family protein [uncultured Nocardioides sp.]
MLHLVRHGRPAIDPAVPARRWRLDHAHVDAVRELRSSGRVPAAAVWATSPEMKALETARALTSGPVAVVDDLREHDRDAGWLEDFDDAVARAFTDPDSQAVPGWEPLRACGERVRTAYERLRAEHPTAPLVLVGHGTSWTLLVAHLLGLPVDSTLLPRWRSWGMPDVVSLDA